MTPSPTYIKLEHINPIEVRGRDEQIESLVQSIKHIYIQLILLYVYSIYIGIFLLYHFYPFK